MAAPFIAAYKDGSTSINSYITEDKLIYWYRPTPKGLDCDATDNTMSPANNASGNFFEGRPNGWQEMADEVFVVSLLTQPATIEATSGNQSKTFSAQAGASAFSLPMGIGKQSFSVTRNGQTVLSGTSLKDIVDTCICGIYNFNAYVGQLPAPSTIDALQPAGLASLSAGLKVPCPTNTLLSATAPPMTPAAAVATATAA
ncbi:hypothetical protein VTN77DRAFT_4043 [Rasamsonia byssochlamydoides]|uniref:uncharacterized protein n=1 Tax=Rasamsonia byssochlamydoides TaxID=89139 RepID=UPI0037428FD6